MRSTTRASYGRGDMADSMSENDRDGFSPWPSKGKFVPSFATLLFKPSGPHLIFRVEVLPSHCNGAGIAHGGFLSTLADVWLGNNVAHQLPQGTRIVTANLSVDFLSPIASGIWLESAIDRIKIGSRLCHASGAIVADGQPVVAMRATFAPLAR